MSCLCSCCSTLVTDEPFYSHARVPATNNRVYSSAESARNAKTGEIRLTVCPGCGLIFNSAFDSSRVSYDAGYNNSRTNSNTYNVYLNEVANICRPGLAPESCVLEVGCGNGDFLKELVALTGCNAFGFDPAYTGEEGGSNKPVFQKCHYSPSELSVEYDLLVLRHILEHIPNLYEFISSIISPQSTRVGVRILVEVPSMEWIVNNRAFYDITYEHCNYFSPESLRHLLSRVGVAVERITETFSGQYLLVEGVYKGGTLAATIDIRPTVLIDKLNHAFVEATQGIISNIMRTSCVAVWGASGKGVVFLGSLAEPVLSKISFVIDINPEKQGKFIPGTGRVVSSPNVLKNATGNLLVIVMNEVYAKEIDIQIKNMGVEAELLVMGKL